MNESTDWVCLICCELSPFKVFGKCNHPICITCSAKLRDLCGQKYCAVCREDLEKVIGVFQYTLGTFETLESKCKISASKPGYKFEDQKLNNAFRELFAMKCKLCKQDCKTVVNLEAHLKQQHYRYFCKICKSNLKIFVKDLAIYSKEALRAHNVKGDNIDTSMKGHPLCEFCQDRYLDNETLHLHLRKKHFWCHFCESQAFYCTYTDLRLHFKQAHFLCERGECMHEQITNVFRGEIDLQAHVTSRHISELGKAQQKQMRYIQPGFTTVRAAGRSRGFHGRVYEEQRPSGSSAMRILDEQITELGNWNEPNSAIRPSSSRGAKPSLGYKNKVKRDPVPSDAQPNTSSRSNASSTSNPSSGGNTSSGGSQSQNTSSGASLSQNSRETQKPKSSKSNDSRRDSPRDSPRASPVTYRRDMTQGETSRRGEGKSHSTVPASSSRPASAPARPGAIQPTKEVGRPPPTVPSDEPDVGNPPGEEFPLGDDDDYRQKKKTKKQPKANEPYPMLGRGKPRDATRNSVWNTNGKPRPLHAGPRPRQSRKQQKAQHSDEYDDSDFTWLEVQQTRDRSRSNERGSRNQKHLKQNKAAAVSNKTTHGTPSKENSADGTATTIGSVPKDSRYTKENRKTAEEASKCTKEGSKSRKEGSKAKKEDSKSKSKKEDSNAEEDDVEVPADKPPENCCIPNNPWGDDDPDISVPPKVAHNKQGKRKENTLTKELSEIGKQQAKQKQNGLAKELSEIGKQARIKEKEDGLAKELSELGRQLSTTTIKSTEDPVKRDVVPPPPSMQEIFQDSIKRDKDPSHGVPAGLPEPREMKHTLNKTLRNYPPLGSEEAAPNQEVESYGPPVDPGNLSDKSEYPPLNPSKPNVSLPKPLAFTKKLNLSDEGSYPPLGPPPSCTQQPKNKFKPLRGIDPTAVPFTPQVISTAPSYTPLALSTSSSPPPDLQAIFNSQHKSDPVGPPLVSVAPPDIQAIFNANSRSNTPPGFPQQDLKAVRNSGMQRSSTPPGMPVRNVQNGRMNGTCNGASSRNGPPGFDKPPGFAGPPPPAPTPPPPPGLASYQDIISPNSTYLNSVPPKHGYQTVQNAAKRNKELWLGLSEHLGPMLFTQFHSVVTAFRESKVDTCSFIRICRKFINMDQFDGVFEELVVLLPNISLQRELYKGLGNPPNLVPCTVCNQVIKKQELIHHSQYHNFDIRTKYHTNQYHNPG